MTTKDAATLAHQVAVRDAKKAKEEAFDATLVAKGALARAHADFEEAPTPERFARLATHAAEYMDAVEWEDKAQSHLSTTIENARRAGAIS